MCAVPLRVLLLLRQSRLPPVLYPPGAVSYGRVRVVRNSPSFVLGLQLDEGQLGVRLWVRRRGAAVHCVERPVRGVLQEQPSQHIQRDDSLLLV